MTTPYQPLTISYGAFSISNSNKSSYTLNELDWGADYSRLKAIVTFNVMVKGDTDSEVNSRSNALEEAYRGRRDTLTISVNGNTYRSYSSTNKEVISTIRLLRDDTFTSKTRLYEVSIEADLDPPDDEIRTIQGVTLTYAPNRVRTMRIVIDYHSTGATTAKTNYESDTAIWGTLLAAWAGGSTDWWLPEETIDGDIDLNSKLTVTRTYTEKIKKAEVDYGGFSVGGSSTAYDLVDGWSFKAGLTDASVSFVVRVSGTSDSDLASKSNDLEEAFRKRQQTLELKYDGATQRDFSGSNIHLNSSATATALDNPWFGTNTPATTTGETFDHTRDYRVDITIDMPPNDDTDGRIEEEYTLNQDPAGIATVSIATSYYSLEGSDSRTLMLADFEDYTELVKTRLSITLWEQLNFDTSEVPIDQSGTLVAVKTTARATFREIHYSATSGIGSIGADTNITDFVLNFSISRKYPGDTLQRQVEEELRSTCISEERSVLLDSLGGRLSDIRISFSYYYKKDAPTEISTYYRETVRLLILVYMESLLPTYLGKSPLISIIDEDVGFEEANQNKVSGVIAAQALTTASLYGKIRARVTENFGKIITNTYDGNPHSKISQQGEAERIRAISGTVTIALIGDNLDLPRLSPKDPIASQTGWETLTYSEEQVPITFGDPDAPGENFEVIEYTFEERQVWIEKPQPQIFGVPLP